MAATGFSGTSGTGWVTRKLIIALVLIAIIDVLGYQYLGMSEVVPSIDGLVDWEQLWTDLKVTSSKVSLSWYVTFVVALLLTAYFLSKPKWFKTTLTVLSAMLFVFAIFIKPESGQVATAKGSTGTSDWRLVGDSGTLEYYKIDKNGIYLVIRYVDWSAIYHCNNNVGTWQYSGHHDSELLRCRRKGDTITMRGQHPNNKSKWFTFYLKKG